MSVTTFDTIKYFDELITAGVPKAQAKAQVNVLKRVVTAISDSKLVSKVDSKDLKVKKRFIFLEVLIEVMAAVLVLSTLKSLF